MCVLCITWCRDSKHNLICSKCEFCSPGENIYNVCEWLEGPLLFSVLTLSLNEDLVRYRGSRPWSLLKPIVWFQCSNTTYYLHISLALYENTSLVFSCSSIWKIPHTRLYDSHGVLSSRCLQFACHHVTDRRVHDFNWDSFIVNSI